MKSYKSDKIWEDWKDCTEWHTLCPECLNYYVIRQAFGDDWACKNKDCKYYNGYKAAKEKEYVEGYRKWGKQQEAESNNERFNKLLREAGSIKMLEWAEENRKHKDFITDLKMYLYYHYHDTNIQKDILNLIKSHEIKL